MASLLKPTRPYPLPPNAETVTRNGRLHVRIVQNGKPTFYPVTKDGTKYLKPAKRWYVEYRDANGTLRREKGFTDRKVTEQLARELERKTERMQAGLHDPTDDH